MGIWCVVFDVELKPLPYGLRTFVFLTKRTFKSTQICKTRTCVRTCDGWPNESARKFMQVTKRRKFHACDQLVSTCFGWPNGKNLRDLHTNWSSTKVNTSHCESTQVGGKRNASRTHLRRLPSPFGQDFTGLRADKTPKKTGHRTRYM